MDPHAETETDPHAETKSYPIPSMEIYVFLATADTNLLSVDLENFKGGDGSICGDGDFEMGLEIAICHFFVLYPPVKEFSKSVHFLLRN